MNTQLILYIVIIAASTYSKSLEDAESGKLQAENNVVAVPLIDFMKAPLVATFDMSQANDRVKKFVEEAIQKKMAELVKTKLEEVLSYMKLEENLKKYIDNLENNLTVSIREYVEETVRKPIQDSNKINKGEVALAACTASTSDGHVEAVQRTVCDGKPDGSCHDVCKRRDQRLSCFDAVHVYNRESASYAAAHKYGIGGCDATYCGPNYCCCKY